MTHFLSPVFETGFFESAQVHTALLVGAVVAVVAASVGSFAVLRGQSFAGEALADIGTTGGSGAFLLGVGPLWGFLALGSAAAAPMELIGVQRARGRDLATGAELAAARGVHVRLVGALYLLALVLAVALASLTIGTILGTALLVGPGAASMSLTARPVRAALAAAVLAVLAMWLGIVLAYDSYYWPPHGRGWPVSFFVVTLVFIFYLLSGLPRMWRERRA